jgi:flagellar hook-basal body complex protein FliE
MNVSTIGPATHVVPQSPAVQPSGTAEPARSFGQAVTDLLQGANSQQLQADAAINDLAAGNSDGVHQVVLAVAKADLAFRMVLEIRNRLIESYQEVMRMQV